MIDSADGMSGAPAPLNRTPYPPQPSTSTTYSTSLIEREQTLGTPTFERLRRIPLSVRLDCAKKEQPSKPYDVRMILAFAGLSMHFHLQKHLGKVNELKGLDTLKPLRDQDPDLQYEWGLDRGCYAAVAWQTEQLLKMRDAKQLGPEYDALSEAAKRAALCLVSGMFPLQHLLDKYKQCQAEEYQRKKGLTYTPNITLKLDPFDPQVTNGNTLKLKGSPRDVIAFYRTATMPTQRFYTACWDAVGLGCNANQTFSRFNPEELCRAASAECFGFLDQNISYYLDEARRCQQERRLENILRPVFIKPFAAIWESGALLQNQAPALTAEETELECRLAHVRAIYPAPKAA